MICQLQPSASKLENLLNELVCHFSRNDVIQKVFAFGSFARGDWDCWSDLDLLLITSRNLALDQWLTLVSSFKPILHRSNFSPQVEPAGGFLLGVTFVDESVFHKLDLNFITVEEFLHFESLNRFGKLKLLYESSDLLPNVGADDFALKAEGLIERQEQQLENAIHWTHKAVKVVLRGQASHDRLAICASKLAELADKPGNFHSNRGDIISIANAYLIIAEQLLG